MPRVVLTQNLRRHVDLEQCSAAGSTIREVLDDVFVKYPKLRGYLLDDRGAVRKHIAIVLDGESVLDRETLSDEVEPDSEVFVMQALSGG